MSRVDATAEELLALIQKMFPRECDRAMAELTIQKQAVRIQELEAQVIDARVGHKHPHEDGEQE
jgi:hypothetical protein